jgi:hypothetical protein
MGVFGDFRSVTLRTTERIVWVKYNVNIGRATNAGRWADKQIKISKQTVVIIHSSAEQTPLYRSSSTSIRYHIFSTANFSQFRKSVVPNFDEVCIPSEYFITYVKFGGYWLKVSDYFVEGLNIYIPTGEA